MVLQVLHSQQAIRAPIVRAVSRQLEVRSEACSALSLKPKQDYFFTFPNKYSVLQDYVRFSSVTLPYSLEESTFE